MNHFYWTIDIAAKWNMKIILSDCFKIKSTMILYEQQFRICSTLQSLTNWISCAIAVYFPILESCIIQWYILHVIQVRKFIAFSATCTFLIRTKTKINHMVYFIWFSFKNNWTKFHTKKIFFVWHLCLRMIGGKYVQS